MDSRRNFRTLGLCLLFATVLIGVFSTPLAAHRKLLHTFPTTPERRTFNINVHFTPDSSFLLEDYGLYDGRHPLPAVLWNVKSGKRILSLERQYRKKQVTLGRMGNVIGWRSFFSDHDRVEIVGMKTGKRISFAKRDSIVGSAVFGPRQKVFATSDKNTIRMISVSTGKVLWSKTMLPDVNGGRDKYIVIQKVFNRKATTLAITVGKYKRGLVFGSYEMDGKITLLDVTSGKLVGTIETHTDRISRLGFGPHGRLLLHGKDVWDIARKKKRFTVSDDGHPVFSHNGKTIYSHEANEVTEWDVSTGKRTVRMKISSKMRRIWIDGITIHNNGEFLVAHDWISNQKVLGTARFDVWRLSTNKHVATLEGVALSPDCTKLATITTDKKINVWDVSSLMKK